MSDSLTEAERDAQAKRVESVLDRIHWPQAFMFAFFLVCVCVTPIAFFSYVPERIQDKLANLPWTTILAVGLPALGAGISGFLSPFMRSMVAKKDPDAKSPSTGTVKASVTITAVPPVVEDRATDPEEPGHGA